MGFDDLTEHDEGIMGSGYQMKSSKVQRLVLAIDSDCLHDESSRYLLGDVSGMSCLQHLAATFSTLRTCSEGSNTGGVQSLVKTLPQSLRSLSIFDDIFMLDSDNKDVYYDQAVVEQIIGEVCTLLKMVHEVWKESISVSVV